MGSRPERNVFAPRSPFRFEFLFDRAIRTLGSAASGHHALGSFSARPWADGFVMAWRRRLSRSFD